MTNKTYEDLLKDINDIENNLVAKIIEDAYAGVLVPLAETVMVWNDLVKFRLDGLFSIDRMYYTLIIWKNERLSVSIDVGANDELRTRFKYAYQFERKRKLNALWGRLGEK